MKNKITKHLVACGVGTLALAFVAASATNTSYLPASLDPAGNTMDYNTATGYTEEHVEEYMDQPSWEEHDYDEIREEEYMDQLSWEEHDYDSTESHNTAPTYSHDGSWDSTTDEWTDEDRDRYEKEDQEKIEHDRNEFEQKQNDLLRELNNRTRDLRKLKRSVAKNPQLKQILGEIESKTQEIKNCANSTSYSSDDPTGHCWDLFENLNPLFEKAYLAEESTYIQRELKDIDRMKMREITRMEKEGVDVTDVRAMVNKIKNLLEKMASATDSQTREDLRWEKQDLWDELQREMDEARQSREFAQFNEQCDRHVKMEVERAKKELSRESIADPVLISKLDGLVATCKKIITDAQNKGMDGWEIGDALRENVWEKLEKLTRSMHEGRMCKDVAHGAKKLEYGITEEAPKMIENAPTSVKPELESLVRKGKQILDEAWKALSVDDCDKAARIMENAEELGWRFEKIMKKSGIQEGLIDYTDQYEEIYEDFEDGEFNMEKEKFKSFMKEKQFGLNEMNRMKKLPREILADYVEISAKTNDRTLEFASAAGLENTKLQALIQAKTELMTEVESLRSQVKGLKQEIQNITTELTDYNFGIGAAKDEAKTLAGRLATLGETEAREEFRKLKEKAIEQKVEDGLIGFRDADDTADNWFAAFALKTKNKGLINGNADGTLNPGGNLNYSEAAIAFGRIAGLKNHKSNSRAAGNLADWAEQGVAALEEKNVNLDFMGNVNADDSIKREEVAVLINEVLGLKNVTVTGADFADINEADSREKQAIANVNAAGIMTGKGGTNEFGVGENLSRAALTKVLDLATEIDSSNQ